MPQAPSNPAYKPPPGKGPTSAGNPVVPKAAPAAAAWDPNSIKPPPGVPVSFWQNVQNDPQNAWAFKWLADPATSGHAPHGNFASKGELLKFLQDRSVTDFGRLPQSEQQKYTTADQNGGVDPNSVEGKLAGQKDLINQTGALNEADFGTLGVPEAELEAAVKDAASGNADAIAHLNELIGQIKDPEIAQYVGDYVSQAANAAPDQRDVDAQNRQLAKLEGLSDPTITAEEKLMMEMSRRQTESDLRGQRGAILNDLQARGVYGSGAEITQNAMAQQEAAQRQALEMLGAQANASKRAMDALHGASSLSTSMRGASAQESQFRGTAADKATEFNRNLRTAYDQWKDKTLRQENQDQITRGQTVVSGVKEAGQGNVDAVKSIYTGAETAAKHKIDNRNTTLGLLLDPTGRGVDRAAQIEGEEKIKT